MLAVYFEELSLRQAEERAEAEKRAKSSNVSTNVGGEMDTDVEIGDDDEIDYFEAKKRGLI